MYGIYIINRAGGLIYQYDHNMSRVEVEKTFSYPLELVLKIFDEKVVVDFGQRDGIKGNAPVPTSPRLVTVWGYTGCVFGVWKALLYSFQVLYIMCVYYCNDVSITVM